MNEAKRFHWSRRGLARAAGGRIGRKRPGKTGLRRRRMDLGLQGKKAIIVGAARGIGMAPAAVLARAGCDLAITARSADGVKDAVENLRQNGPTALGKAVNLQKD